MNYFKFLVISVFSVCALGYNNSYSQIFSPSVIEPKNNIISSDSSFVFAWNIVAGTISYNLMISTDPLFVTSVLDSTNSAHVITKKLNTSGKYFWRVRAFDGVSFSAWSETRKFNFFVPSSVSGLAVWLKSESGVDTLPTGEVTQWSDQSISANDALQLTGSMQPKYTGVISGLNGYKTVYFDGVNDFMSFTQPLPLMLSTQAVSIFSVVIPELVGKYNAYGGGGLLRAHPGSDVVGSWYTGLRGNGQVAMCHHKINGADPTGSLGLLSPLVIDQKPHIVEWIWNTNVETLYNNEQGGSLSSSGTGSGWLTGDGELGRGLQFDQSAHFKGNVAEVLVYTGVMADTTRLKIERYLHNKYAPPVNLGFDIVSNYFCDTMLDASSSFVAYLWSTGATTQSITVSSPGAYWVSVTDVFGESSSDSVNVSFPGNLTPFSGNVTTICAGSSTSWNTNLTPASSYTFAWSTGETTSAITIIQAGQYSVSVTDLLGCMRTSGTVTVSVDNFSQPGLVSLGPDVSMCAGGSITLVSGSGQATQYAWSNGETTSSIVINTTGMNTYSLVVQNSAGCTAKDTINVNVKGVAPSVGFVSPSVCLGVTSIFTDTTKIFAQDSIASWAWNFGDGNVASLQNSSHTYTASGTYTVSLSVASDSGCVNTATDTLVVYVLPEPGFFSSYSFEGCVDVLYLFNDTSVAASPDIIISRQWDFGDGANGVGVVVQHTYTMAGSYSVGLTVLTARGCSAQEVKTVNVYPADTLPLSFSLFYPFKDVVVPDDPILFQWYSSLFSYKYTLELSLDSFATISASYPDLFSTQRPVSGLSMGQTYYWRVIAYNSCLDSVVSEARKFIFFSPSSLSGMSLWLKPDIGVDTLLTGEVSQWNDQSVSGNDATQSTGSMQPKYTGGITMLNGYKTVYFDGANDYMNFTQPLPLMTSSQAVSIFTVIIPELTGRYSNYGGGGLLRAYPGAEAAGSWYAGIRGNGQVAMCHHRISGSDPTGSIGLQSPLATDLNPLIAEWLWDTIDESLYNGGQASNLSLSPTGGGWLAGNGELGRGLQLDQPAHFKGNVAEILVYTSVIADSTRLMIEQYLHDKYAPPVNLGPDIVSGYLCDTVLDASPRFLSYLWSTGVTTQTLAISQSGTYSVTATDVFGHASSDVINVTFPGNFSPFPGNATTICAGSSVQWNTNLSPASSYTFAWSTGATTSAINITQAGQYSVTVTDLQGCTRASNTMTVTVDNFSQPGVVSLGPDISMCAGSNIALVNGAGATEYVWSTGETTASIVINTTGMSTYSVTVKNAFGCTARDTITVNVKGIAPSVGFVSPAACFGDASLFTDTTKIFAQDSIASWLWDFGDASTSSALNPTHTYSAAGTYTAYLTVVTDSGCTVTLAKSYTVNEKPAASFIVATSPICSGLNVQFMNSSSISSGSIVSHSWDFGDGTSTSSVKNPLHTYSVAGTYTVQLIETSSFSCKDTVVISITVLQSPVAVFSADTVCFGTATTFTDNTPGTIIDWFWDFGDALTSTIQNPAHAYAQAGLYTAQLTVTASNGCAHMGVGTVVVDHLPVPGFTGDSICMNSYLQFTDTSKVTGSTVSAWHWQFGPSTGSGPNPTFTYSAAGNYSVTLTATSAQGCSASVTQTVVVMPLPVAGFSFSPSYSYPQVPVSFTNISTGGTSYLWSFGDGTSTSSVADPIHTYTNTGTYAILLITQSAFGCIHSSLDSISIDVPVLDMEVQYVSAVNSSNAIQVYSFLKNTGTLDVTSIELSAFLDDGTPVHEFWSGLKRPGESLPYPFNSTFELVNNKHSMVCVEVKKVNGKTDDVASNNKKCTAITDEFTLLNPFPNPTVGEIYFLFVSPDASSVKAEIIDARGRVVATPFDGTAAKGLNQISFNTIKLLKGIYWIKLSNGDKVLTKQFVKE